MAKRQYRLRKDRPVVNSLASRIFNFWHVKCRECKVEDITYGYLGGLRWIKIHHYYFHSKPEDFAGKTFTFKVVSRPDGSKKPLIP